MIISVLEKSLSLSLFSIGIKRCFGSFIIYYLQTLGIIFGYEK